MLVRTRSPVEGHSVACATWAQSANTFEAIIIECWPCLYRRGFNEDGFPALRKSFWQRACGNRSSVRTNKDQAILRLNHVVDATVDIVGSIYPVG